LSNKIGPLPDIPAKKTTKKQLATVLRYSESVKIKKKEAKPGDKMKTEGGPRNHPLTRKEAALA
jgi:hypothetical protein